ncbi:hypothetical protein A2291_07415 [candidate division WOR-1 bacterium RIFOXYB2_FULL_42_35]|uniref:YggT family protein n=1 Tax=candidate division WOR-1 bacterium RIFOXYC2_FULL_41_25 TaxID=1802586 RepID=A0A1F4TKA2_UNCSA|nr:MAG: hypothetical protein A2247_04275 [candidate division WOR-1 bacterium RIFOXYA2_FULL_41_14]OGC22734.1 MAG: hypothetical protein A2291_07415 [candidate division WOR-1 bacterium RIFOXYB2_FULL_42_35]OGC33155.1 MAG: hypothetical protein A2462_06310 [candidate division WOR-1 bacterium RIFOXYC2_FULL_41_25]OGC43555.1 MAG: hypothetical protein A2548_04050 [candidate division WOR-1 bacterium RIFOXYD2_FULL_41_8]
MDFIIFIVNFVFSALYILLALRAILPWVPNSKRNHIFAPVYALTEPLVVIVRLALPPQWMGMDVSPFVVIILLWVLQKVMLQLLAVL